MELERAKALQHDLIKSYVRLPDLQQKRMLEFAHSVGVPVATHEIYPAAFVAVDNTEHTAATSCPATHRNRPPSTLARMWCSCSARAAHLLFDDLRRRDAKDIRRRAWARDDRRFKLYPDGFNSRPRALRRGNRGVGPAAAAIQRRRRQDGDYIMKAGGLLVTGTDRPNAIDMHGELMAYTMAVCRLRRAQGGDGQSREALNVDTGTIEAGKLADIIMIEGTRWRTLPSRRTCVA